MSVITRKVSLLLVTLAAGTTAVGVSIGVGQDKAPKPIPEALPQPSPAPVASVPTLKAPDLQPPLVAPPQANPAPAPTPSPAKLSADGMWRETFGRWKITAPDAVTARAIANEANYLGGHLPQTWFRKSFYPGLPISIFAKREAGEANSLIEHAYNPKNYEQTSLIELSGSLDSMLRVQLPRNMMHLILKETLGTSLPGWVDDGVGLMVQPVEEQIKYDHLCRDLVNSGEAVRLKFFLPQQVYPNNSKRVPPTKGQVAQGHSLVRFLLTRKPHNSGSPEKLEGDTLARVALMHFVTLGSSKEGWQNAARVVYGYDTIDEMEEAWLAWLRKPESMMKQPSDKAPPAPEVPRVESQTIPAPANRLPGGTRKEVPTVQEISQPVPPPSVQPTATAVPMLPQQVLPR